jgi:hypothetical protein
MHAACDLCDVAVVAEIACDKCDIAAVSQRSQRCCRDRSSVVFVACDRSDVIFVACDKCDIAEIANLMGLLLSQFLKIHREREAGLKVCPKCFFTTLEQICYYFSFISLSIFLTILSKIVWYLNIKAQL